MTNLNEQLEALHEYKILTKLAGAFYTAYEINLQDYSMRELSAPSNITQYITEGVNAVETMKTVMTAVVVDEDKDRVLAFSDLTTLADRMRGKAVITDEFRGKNAGWCKQQFITVDADSNGKPTYVIHTTEVIDEQKRKEETFIKNEQKQISIIQGLAGDFVSIYYIDLESEEFDVYRKSPNQGTVIQEEMSGIGDYFETAAKNGMKFVVPQDRHIFLEKFNKAVIESELKKNKEYSFQVRVYVNDIPTYFQYRFVRPVGSDSESKMVVGVYNVDAQVRNHLKNQEQLIRLRTQADQLTIDAYRDAMTGLYNRRAYEEDMVNEAGVLGHEDYSYLAIDINGLKNINDHDGHDAGDELILGCAFCINKCLSTYGKVYRIGGDEFAAILFVNPLKLLEIIEDFNHSLLNWSGDKVKELTVALGYVTRSEFPNNTVKELAKIADQRMYNYKEEFYRRKGIDRRGQQDAYAAICNTYTKILKVNLTKNTYAIIQMSLDEKRVQDGFSEGIYEWLTGFAQSGRIHPDDVEHYLSQTSEKNLTEFFKAGNTCFALYYSRMIAGEFKKALMEIVPASEYTDENQVVYIYVKDIDR